MSIEDIYSYKETLSSGLNKQEIISKLLQVVDTDDHFEDLLNLRFKNNNGKPYVGTLNEEGFKIMKRSQQGRGRGYRIFTLINIDDQAIKFNTMIEAWQLIMTFGTFLAGIVLCIVLGIVHHEPGAGLVPLLIFILFIHFITLLTTRFEGKERHKFLRSIIESSVGFDLQAYQRDQRAIFIKQLIMLFGAGVVLILIIYFSNFHLLR